MLNGVKEDVPSVVCVDGVDGEEGSEGNCPEVTCPVGAVVGRDGVGMEEVSSPVAVDARDCCDVDAAELDSEIIVAPLEVRLPEATSLASVPVADAVEMVDCPTLVLVDCGGVGAALEPPGDDEAEFLTKVLKF